MDPIIGERALPLLLLVRNFAKRNWPIWMWLRRWVRPEGLPRAVIDLTRRERAGGPPTRKSVVRAFELRCFAFRSRRGGTSDWPLTRPYVSHIEESRAACVDSDRFGAE